MLRGVLCEPRSLYLSYFVTSSARNPICNLRPCLFLRLPGPGSGEANKATLPPYSTTLYGTRIYINREMNPHRLPSSTRVELCLSSPTLESALIRRNSLNRDFNSRPQPFVVVFEVGTTGALPYTFM